jgi:hypothetical protein
MEFRPNCQRVLVVDIGSNGVSTALDRQNSEFAENIALPN